MLSVEAQEDSLLAPIQGKVGTLDQSFGGEVGGLGAGEESREAFVRRFARDGVSREQAEAMWTETHRTMKFADIDCRDFAR